MNIKYRNGYMKIKNLNELSIISNLSASMVNQALQLERGSLQKLFGYYNWSLEQYSLNHKRMYKILAKAGKDIWTESIGVTPKKALINFLSNHII